MFRFVPRLYSVCSLVLKPVFVLFQSSPVDTLAADNTIAASPEDDHGTSHVQHDVNDEYFIPIEKMEQSNNAKPASTSSVDSKQLGAKVSIIVQTLHQPLNIHSVMLAKRVEMEKCQGVHFVYIQRYAWYKCSNFQQFEIHIRLTLYIQ